MGLLDKIFGSRNEMNKKFRVGDWINSYSKGIYRIEHIIDEYYDESYPLLGNNKIGDKRKHRTIVSKRLLNSKYKKSISYDSCSEFYISHLDSKQKFELNKILSEKPEFLNELDKYKIPKRTTVYNSELQIDNELDLEMANQLVVFIKNGKTFLQIQNEMERLDILRLKPKNFGNYRLQFFNYDNEYIEKRKIWRDAKLTKS